MKASTKISVVVTALVAMLFVGLALKKAAEDVVDQANARDAQIKALFEDNR